ncbi:ABC transporter substrate-binding protein [Plantactinospora soyae]|uniref:Multiple sugar transport system substrate-binding protein n=1 Tax=Plantactinospora soyae TaxID=1544732 RepID=A0A927MCE2_9ACTN|nr:extracellular solute-binding protein [Plantactinospora soyae]MBE1491889.1 multiple sugar transport system substrate-binding protein [Plantactinospora soyae]
MSGPTPGLSRRRFLGTSLLFVGGAAISGCQTDPTGSGSGGAKVTLNHWYHEYGEQGTREAAMRYAADYTKQNPDVAVKVTWVPGDYKTKWQSSVLTPEGPDIYEINEVTPDMVAQQQVAALDDILGAAKGELNEHALSPLTHGGKAYGVPMIIDVMLLYYRKSLLSAAGVQPPKTLTELVSAAKALTRGKTKGIFVGNDGLAGMRNLLPFSVGQNVLTGRRVSYATPEIADAFALVRRMFTDKSMLLGYATEWYDPGALITGATAIAWGGLWALPQIKKELVDDFDLIPWPAHGPGGKPVVILGGWSQVVNGKSKHVAEAKKYIQWLWLQNNEVQQDWALSYGFHVPPRAGLAAQAEPLRSGPAKTAIDLLNQYGTRTTALWAPTVSKPYDDAVSDIVKKNADPMATLGAAAQRSQEALDKLPTV